MPVISQSNLDFGDPRLACQRNTAISAVNSRVLVRMPQGELRISGQAALQATAKMGRETEYPLPDSNERFRAEKPGVLGL